MRAGFIALTVLFIPAAPALAGGLVVHIDDGHGKPTADAVVTARREGDTARAGHASTVHTIDQRYETFVPYVELIRPGDQVVFRNSDRTRHHVYSFSPVKWFEFVIAPGASTPPLTLDQPGEISVGCNIHDQMITHLVVSDAPWIALSGTRGDVAFEGLRPGTYVVEVWHPQLRPGKAGPRQTLVVGEAPSTVTFSLALLPDPRLGTGDRERNRY